METRKMSEPLLVARDVGHKFARTWLYRHLDIDLLVGDRLIVTGKNGSGKSTLLKNLAGLTFQTEGEIWHPVPFGYASLDLALYPDLTCGEHLLLSAEARGIEPEIDALLEQTHLSEAKNKVASKLSSGMKLRLKVALALQGSPQLLILDEATAPLDEQGKEWIHHMVSNFEGGIILATNDPNDRRLATHAFDLG